jgi:hypothetical protein
MNVNLNSIPDKYDIGIDPRRNVTVPDQVSKTDPAPDPTPSADRTFIYFKLQ